ncbi:hypothetical protein LEP1GSC074_2543 [Leptospira noguchii str. Hook]|nr:hypothetical protein LEP1GSC074_2543 [Leptospira noguchii str. Hook]
MAASSPRLFYKKKPGRDRALLSGQVIVFPLRILYFSNANNLTSSRSLAVVLNFEKDMIYEFPFGDFLNYGILTL